MKIFSTDTFEKLKIRPVNVSDISYVNISKTVNRKSELQTYDIIKYANTSNPYSMVFYNDNFELYSDFYANEKYVEYGIFFNYNDKSEFPRNYMKMYFYDEDLAYPKNENYSISDVWIHPDDYTLLDPIEFLTQDYLQGIIKVHGFVHKKLR